MCSCISVRPPLWGVGGRGRVSFSVVARLGELLQGSQALESALRGSGAAGLFYSLGCPWGTVGICGAVFIVQGGWGGISGFHCECPGHLSLVAVPTLTHLQRARRPPTPWGPRWPWWQDFLSLALTHLLRTLTSSPCLDRCAIASIHRPDFLVSGSFCAKNGFVSCFRSFLQ